MASGNEKHNQWQREYYARNKKACQARVTDWKHRNVERMREKQNGYYIASVLKSLKQKGNSI